MGFGSFLLRQMVGAPMRHSNSLIHTAVASAGAAAGAAVVANLMNNRQPETPKVPSRGSQVYDAQLAQRKAEEALYANTMLGKIAVCCYIAQADGVVSPEEKMEIDAVATSILADPRLSEENKKKVRDIVRCTNISFSQVEGILSKADSGPLISFVNDIERIARTNGGITALEQKAIRTFKEYVSKRTGYSFPDEVAPDLKSVDLTCTHCGGLMDVDSSMLKATCMYCGASKIIDATQISAVVAELERRKRNEG